MPSLSFNVNVAVTLKFPTIQQADTRLFNYSRCITIHHHTDYGIRLTLEQLPDDNTLVLKYVAFIRHKYVLTNTLCICLLPQWKLYVVSRWDFWFWGGGVQLMCVCVYVCVCARARCWKGAVIEEAAATSVCLSVCLSHYPNKQTFVLSLGYFVFQTKLPFSHPDSTSLTAVKLPIVCIVCCYIKRTMLLLLLCT